MITFGSQVSIDRPADTIFPYLIEPEKQVLWSGAPMRQVTPGALATGSKMEVTFGFGPLKATIGLEFTSVEPGRRIAFDSYSGPIGWRGEYRLEPGDGGTTVSQEGSLDFRGLWRLLEPLAGAEIKNGEIKELERLKAVVEAG